MRNSITLLLLAPLFASAQNIHITAGCKFNISGPVNLVLNNMGFVNDGSFAPGIGTISFTGSNTNIIGGTGPIAFFNAAINKPSGEMQLTRDIALTGAISMSSGRLNVENQVLSLGSSGIILGERNESNITGSDFGMITATRTINSATMTNPGNIGVEMLTNNKSESVTVQRTHRPEGLQGGGQTIDRVFNIQSSSTTSVGKFRFFYLDVELEDADEQSLSVWMRSGIGNFLTPVGRDSIDVANNWVLKNGVPISGHYALASPNFAVSRVNQNTVSTQKSSDENSKDLVSKVKVYPVPVQNNCIMELVSNSTKEVVINLYNVTGKLLQQKQVLISPGINRINLDLAPYASGVYYLSVKNEGMKIIRIMKK